MKVAIIGGGLAGCALAYVLKNAGAEPVIYEAEDTVAMKASGNALGLYNPRLSAHRSAQSDYYVAAFSLAVKRFAAMENIDFNSCGSLHLIVDEKRAKRFPQTLEHWGWEPEHMQMVDAVRASEIAGVELAHDALYLPDAGTVSPRKLCAEYSKDVERRLGVRVDDLGALDADVVVLACGRGVKAHLDWLPVSHVRGQVTDVQATVHSKKLKCNLCYGGYFSPVDGQGNHNLGATFQRWLDHDDAVGEDNEENVSKLAEVVPKLAEGLKVSGHRAGVRVSSKDHFPIVGAVPERDGLYVSTGHGSHGIISSLMAAHLLTDMILGRPYALAGDTVAALSPQRFS
jgi:tRNA 5-methylaminomethyl-2-thiouridine biosynthesis bifunctional protein